MLQQVSPWKQLVGWVGIVDLRAEKGFSGHVDQMNKLRPVKVSDLIVPYLGMAELRPEPKNTEF